MYQCNFGTAIYGPTTRLAEANEFPYIVSIMKLSNNTVPGIHAFSKCSGTLVSRQDVLTSEHCLSSTFTRGFKVMVGSHDLAHTTAYFPMFIMTYEHWTIYRRRRLDRFDHDIAFIKVNYTLKI